MNESVFRGPQFVTSHSSRTRSSKYKFYFKYLSIKVNLIERMM